MGDNDRGNGNFNMNTMLPMLTMLGTQRSGSGDGGQGTIMMLLAIVLPLVLQHLMPKIRDAIDNWQTTWGAQPTRTIAYTRDPSAWWGDDKDDDEVFNGTIQRAILKYINDVLPLVAKEWKQSNVQVRRLRTRASSQPTQRLLPASLTSPPSSAHNPFISHRSCS